METASRNVPKYERLANKVAREIKSGALMPGQPVPSIRNLMSSHKLSIGTVVRHPKRGFWLKSIQCHWPLPRLCILNFTPFGVLGLGFREF